MKFANPIFFWALLSLLVPIIIHLFHFRKFKTIYFTNVRFLRELKQETQSRSRLRHLLILLSRCLALTALVFAFAQPVIPSSAKQRTGSRAISIYIDNSFSLDAQAESGSLLELARKHALDIVRSYKPADRFQLLTNDFEGRHQQLLSREQFEQMLDELKPSPVSRTLTEVVKRQEDLVRQEKMDNGILYLLSDFQKNTSDFSTLKPDTAFDLNCIHLKAQVSDNLSIDSCWFETPFRERSKPDQLAFQI
ncbi:MAG TPA: BatA domain-containing protein, partial [Flavobacteriales bacterium]|nr:BatA domain-containing protein [Flavobacteriales bacterium]